MYTNPINQPSQQFVNSQVIGNFIPCIPISISQLDEPIQDTAKVQDIVKERLKKSSDSTSKRKPLDLKDSNITDISQQDSPTRVAKKRTGTYKARDVKRTKLPSQRIEDQKVQKQVKILTQKNERLIEIVTDLNRFLIDLQQKQKEISEEIEKISS